MKLLLPIAALLFLALPEIGAAPLPLKQFRKFRGVYQGSLSGIAGNLGGSSAVGPFASSIRVTTRRSEMLQPLISGLFTAQEHRINWRKPTGTAGRATLLGYYRGVFINDFGTQYVVAGTRRLILNDRGKSRPKRYVTRLNDDLKESFVLTGNVSAAQDLEGHLRK